MKYIYLLKNTNSFYKIGISENTTRRLADLSTSNPEHLAIVTMKLVEDAVAAERSLHEKYAHFRSRETGEWFKLTDEQVVNVCVDIHKLDGYSEKPYIKEILVAITSLTENQKEMQENINHLMSVFSSLRVTRPKIIIGKDEESSPKKLVAKERIGDSELYKRATDLMTKHKYISTTFLQTRLGIGYSKATRIMNLLEDNGLIGEQQGSRPRKILW